VKWSNENILVWALIENLEGARNAEEIVSVPGLDAIMPGPFDLAHDMGLPGQPAHERVTALMTQVVAHARERGVEVVTNFFSTTPDAMAEERRKWMERGVRIFSIGTDRRLAHHAMLRARAAVAGD
jgi:4-hydroxy-2-oxoheptanedioate aldolase